ncbi:aminotransferase class I/II-fold pyridoxal phosphate-dependent enzyme [Kitasatospora sp. SUK 42]|nr:aminotransferase class I/II-fold pyridoxal phosphate-dependent enzyme [Kitasatospora sp. SUK 42]
MRADPDSEVLVTLGSKEAMAHLALAYVNPGDVVLVPDPAYPVYETWARFYRIPLAVQGVQHAGLAGGLRSRQRVGRQCPTYGQDAHRFRYVRGDPARRRRCPGRHRRIPRAPAEHLPYPDAPTVRRPRTGRPRRPTTRRHLLLPRALPAGLQQRGVREAAAGGRGGAWHPGHRVRAGRRRLRTADRVRGHRVDRRGRTADRRGHLVTVRPKQVRPGLD